jgi:predicted nucleic acid-binding protein
VKFWDSSAIVPLLLAQPKTPTARALLRSDPEQVAWWGSGIECASAIARLQRDGHLATQHAQSAYALLSVLQDSWYEMQPGENIKQQALRLLRLHPLRAADALQLAAAIEWAGSPPAGGFVTFDERLAAAAEREGFSIQ